MIIQYFPVFLLGMKGLVGKRKNEAAHMQSINLIKNFFFKGGDNTYD